HYIVPEQHDRRKPLKKARPRSLPLRGLLRRGSHQRPGRRPRLAASNSRASRLTVLARFRGASGKLFDVLAPGLYTWGVTVGWPVSQRFAPLGSRLGALVALVSPVAGAPLVLTSPRLPP